MLLAITGTLGEQILGRLRDLQTQIGDAITGPPNAATIIFLGILSA